MDGGYIGSWICHHNTVTNNYVLIFHSWPRRVWQKEMSLIVPVLSATNTFTKARNSLKPPATITFTASVCHATSSMCWRILNRKTSHALLTWKEMTNRQRWVPMVSKNESFFLCLPKGIPRHQKVCLTLWLLQEYMYFIAKAASKDV